MECCLQVKSSLEAICFPGIYPTKICNLMNEQSYSAIPLEQPPYISLLDQQLSEKVSENRSKILYTDEAIIAGLIAQNIQIIKYIYKQFFGQIKYLVIANSGTNSDAEDLFQDALVVLYQKVSARNLILTCSFNTFLYSVCKHLWLQKLNKREFNNEYKELVDLDNCQDSNNIDELSEEYEKYKLFQQHFQKLNQKDQKVLKLYIRKISLKEIASIMGYKSEKYAKFRKYLCKEKLKNSILNDPKYQEIYENEHLTPVLNC
jgi:RNA polymerase sigma factor (sigma-70 family)